MNMLALSQTVHTRGVALVSKLDLNCVAQPVHNHKFKEIVSHLQENSAWRNPFIQRFLLLSETSLEANDCEDDVIRNHFAL